MWYYYVEYYLAIKNEKFDTIFLRDNCCSQLSSSYVCVSFSPLYIWIHSLYFMLYTFKLELNAYIHLKLILFTQLYGFEFIYEDGEFCSNHSFNSYLVFQLHTWQPENSVLGFSSKADIPGRYCAQRYIKTVW